MPPETTMPADPARRRSWPSMVAFMPEPQTLLTVVAPTASGKPAARAAWRAGAWPCPAGSTQPIRTSSILSLAIPARSRAALIACAPSALAATGANSPWKRPSGVRTAETMTTGSLTDMHLLLQPIPVDIVLPGTDFQHDRDCAGGLVAQRNT